MVLRYFYELWLVTHVEATWIQLFQSWFFSRKQKKNPKSDQISYFVGSKNLHRLSLYLFIYYLTPLLVHKEQYFTSECQINVQMAWPWSTSTVSMIIEFLYIYIHIYRICITRLLWMDNVWLEPITWETHLIYISPRDPTVTCGQITVDLTIVITYEQE